MGFCKLEKCRHNGERIEGDYYGNDGKVCGNFCQSDKDQFDLAKEWLNIYSKKTKDTYVIIYNNKLLRLPSAKSSWSTLGAAKTAFSNAVYNTAKKFGFIDARHMREVLQKEGIIKFKKLTYE